MPLSQGYLQGVPREVMPTPLNTPPVHTGSSVSANGPTGHLELKAENGYSFRSE